MATSKDISPGKGGGGEHSGTARYPPLGETLYNETSNISYLKNQPGLLEHLNPFKCSPGSHSPSVSCSVGITTYLLASSVSSLGQPWVYVTSALWYVKLVTVLDYSHTSTKLKLQSSCQVNQSKFAWQQCMWHNYCACTDLPTNRQMRKA